jgi:flagellar biosynthesis protein FlhG
LPGAFRLSSPFQIDEHATVLLGQKTLIDGRKSALCCATPARRIAVRNSLPCSARRARSEHMSWEQTLRRLHGRRDGDLQRNGHPSNGRADGASIGTRAAASVCIASGKGGTGKSVITASLATLLSARGETLLVDADLGIGNAHILFDVSPARSLVDVVHGQARVRDVVERCGEHLALVGGGSGVSHMAGLSAYELHLIARGIEEIERDYDYVVVDSAAGISEQTVAFAAACDVVLVVTTPDLTAMTDAYALLKALFSRDPERAPLLAVNRVADDLDGEHEHSGEHVADRLCTVCRRFLGREPRYIGRVPEDRSVVRSVAARRPVLQHAPGSPAALALQALSVPLADELAHAPRRGLGRQLVEAAGFARGG